MEDISQEPPDRTVIDEAGKLPIRDSKDQTLQFSQLCPTDSQTQVLVIFIKHFFCGNCQDYLRKLGETITPSFISSLTLPTTICIVGCGSAELIEWYKDQINWKFALYIDPTTALYDVLGLRKTRDLGPWRPDYMRRSLPKVVVTSIWQALGTGSRMTGGGPSNQIGGVFLFRKTTSSVGQDDERPEVVWCHRMRAGRDYATVESMQAALQSENVGA